jgi:hypothetical protein
MFIYSVCVLLIVGVFLFTHYEQKEFFSYTFVNVFETNKLTQWHFSLATHSSEFSTYIFCIDMELLWAYSHRLLYSPSSSVLSHTHSTAHSHAHTHTHTHTHTHIHTLVRMHTRKLTCSHAHTQTHLLACTHTNSTITIACTPKKHTHDPQLHAHTHTHTLKTLAFTLRINWFPVFNILKRQFW